MAHTRAKRGHRLPKRFIITALLLILQMAIIMGVCVLIGSSFYWAYAVFEVFNALCVIYLVNRRGVENYKMAWIIFILAIPFAGWLFYLVFGGNRVFPYLKHRYVNIEKSSQKLFRHSSDISNTLRSGSPSALKQSTYISNESGYPAYVNTQTEFFPSGEAVFEEILKELKKAEKFIFLEFFILAEGYMWDEIHKILSERVQHGIDVRVLFDDFGSANRQYYDFVDDLRHEGIKVSIFNPIRASSNMFLNNRNHRKIIVIDSKVAFTGGFNIADEYINKINRFGHWLDCGIKLTGDAVKSFTVMFCNMWNFTSKRSSVAAEDYIKYSAPADTSGIVQPYCDGPFDDHHVGEGVYMQLIASARRYVYIATPYLILDNVMTATLERAAKSGVDVRIITPKHEDKWYVHPVTRYNYDQLMDAGVKIYEYSPGFIHSKLFVMDDHYATCGTFNMDYRSFFFHFECGVWMCDTNSVADIKAHLLDVMDKSERIDPVFWKKRSKWERFKQDLLHLFAPFM